MSVTIHVETSRERWKEIETVGRERESAISVHGAFGYGTSIVNDFRSFLEQGERVKRVRECECIFQWSARK